MAGDTRYFTRLADWTQKGNVFSTEFTVPFAWANRQVFFHLGWASADYEVRVNGKAVACDSRLQRLRRNSTSRSHAQEGRNTLEIVVSASVAGGAVSKAGKSDPAPAIGPAWVMSQPTLRVRDVLTKSWRSSEENDKVMAEIALVVKTESLNPRTSRIHYELLTPAGSNAAIGYKDVTLDMRREDTRALSGPHSRQHVVEPRTADAIHAARKNPARRPLHGVSSNCRSDSAPSRLQQRAAGGKRHVPSTLRTREVPAPVHRRRKYAALREQGFNTLKTPAGARVAESLHELFATRMGMYVIPQAPIDTRSSGESRRIGGNPSNDPAWQNAYVERTEDSYHTSKRHPSVIAFSLATKSANGINLYESYLNMKKFSETRPFIYPDAAGEWNSDGLKLE